MIKKISDIVIIMLLSIVLPVWSYAANPENPEEKKIIVEGMINNEVLLNDNGISQRVRNNTEYKECFVIYPDILCGDAAKTKKDGLLAEVNALKRELAQIRDNYIRDNRDSRDRKEKDTSSSTIKDKPIPISVSPPVSPIVPPIMPIVSPIIVSEASALDSALKVAGINPGNPGLNPGPLYLGSLAPAQGQKTTKITLPAIGEVEVTFSGPLVILKVLQVYEEKVGEALGAIVVQRETREKYVYFGIEREKLKF